LTVKKVKPSLNQEVILLTKRRNQAMNTNQSVIWNTGLAPLGLLRREMDRLMDDLWSASPDNKSGQATESSWQPPCDVEEAPNHYLLTLDMPGVSKDQIKLEVLDNQIVISGERRHEQKRNTDTGWYSERRQGKFQRSFTLPVGVDADKLEANYQDGILSVYVPKAESAKPRQIKINNGSSTSFFGRLIGQSSTKDKEGRHLTSDTSKDRAAS
jgi:HSP20 family protein